MGLGNGEYNQGNKGSNWRYEYIVSQNLINIAASTALSATEATLLQVLLALQNGQEFEQNLVMDLGGVGCPAACPTYLEVRIWNSVTHTFDPPQYYTAGGALVVPVGPLQIVNPQYVLQNILLELQAINADIDVPLSTRNTEATQLLVLAALASIDGGIPTALGQALMAASMPVVIASNQSPITIAPQLGALTDGSGSLAAGSVSQQIFAANATRKYLTVQNISSIDLYVNIGAVATIDSNSIKLLPNGSVTFENNFIPTSNVTIIGSTLGAKFIAKEG